MPWIPQPPYDVNVKNYPGSPTTRYRSQNLGFPAGVIGGQSFTIPQGFSWEIISIVIIPELELVSSQSVQIWITDPLGNYLYDQNSGPMAANQTNVFTMAKGLNTTSYSNGLLPPTISSTESFIDQDLLQGWTIFVDRRKFGGGAALAGAMTIWINYIEKNI
jgi:hypothetical protein